MSTHPLCGKTPVDIIPGYYIISRLGKTQKQEWVFNEYRYKDT
jgi:hypothetical protein